MCVRNIQICSNHSVISPRHNTYSFLLLCSYPSPMSLALLPQIIMKIGGRSWIRSLGRINFKLLRIVLAAHSSPSEAINLSVSIEQLRRVYHELRFRKISQKSPPRKARKLTNLLFGHLSDMSALQTWEIIAFRGWARVKGLV